VTVDPRFLTGPTLSGSSKRFGRALATSAPATIHADQVNTIEDHSVILTGLSPLALEAGLRTFATGIQSMGFLAKRPRS
jgi:hypothetical protein